jgi:hypothetical protein
MKYVKVMLLVAIAACALGAASAQAALPEFSGTLPDAGKAESTTPVFENTTSGLVIKCTTSEGTLEVKTAKEAVFDELFLGCEAELSKTKLGKCTGSADTTTGSILAKGTSTLGYALGTLTPLAALTLSPEGGIEIKCALGAKITVKGCVLGTTTLNKEGLEGLKGTLKFEGTAGVQKYTDYTTDSGATKACKLESSVNGGAFAASDQVQTANLTFTKELRVLD